MTRTIILITSLIALMCSCSDYEPTLASAPEEPQKEYRMDFLGSVGFDDESRANYDWPVGAVLYIKLPSNAVTGQYIRAAHKGDGTWTVSNYNGAVASNATCEVMYIEGASVSDYDSYEFDANHPIYFTSTGKFSFAGDFAELRANLPPITGRIRFVSNTNTSNAYANFASYQLDEERNAIASSLGAATTVLKFKYHPDGKWYSQYIYTLDMPNVKVGTTVYKYSAKRTLNKGQSVTINLPNTSSTGWISETYKINSSSNKTISGTKDAYYYLPNCTTTTSSFSSQIGCVRRIKVKVTGSVNENLHFGISKSAGGSVLWSEISNLGTYNIDYYTPESDTYAYIRTNYIIGYSNNHSYAITVTSYSESNF